MTEAKRPDTLELVGEFLESFTALCQRLQLYGRDHPRTEESWRSFEKIRSTLGEVLPNRADKLAIAYHKGRFYFENVPLIRNPQQAHLLKRCFEKSGMGGMLFSLDIEEPALRQVLKQVATAKTKLELETLPEGFRWITSQEVHRYQSGYHGELNVNALLHVGSMPLQAQLYNETMTTLSNFNKQCAADEEPDLAPVQEVVTRLVTAVVDHPSEILPQAMAHYYAEFVLYHSVNVCLLAVRAATLLTEDTKQLEIIAQAALLHDVGASLVGEELLDKDQPLTDQEAFAIMNHPERGARLLQSIPGIHPVAVSSAFGHHVKGSQGYPKIPSGYQTGPVTQLVEVVDIFEALTAHRPYKKAITAPQAFHHLYSEPTLSPMRQYVDLLAQAIGFHPLGTQVRTQGGEKALVCGHVDANPERPIIRRIEISSAGEVGLGVPEEAACGDLPWSEPAVEARTVVTALDPLEELKRSEEDARERDEEPAR